MPRALQAMYVHQQRRLDLVQATLPPAQLPAAFVSAAAEYRTVASSLLSSRGEDSFRVTFSRPAAEGNAKLSILVVGPAAGPQPAPPTVTDDDEEMK
jgi:hypothetical protein